MCYQINIDTAEIWAPLDTTSQRSRWSFAPNPSGVVRKIPPAFILRTARPTDVLQVASTLDILLHFCHFLS